MNFFKSLKAGSSTNFLILFTAFFSVFLIFFMVFTGNGNQTFNDIVWEYTAFTGTNKTPEMFLVYFIPFTGIILYTIFYSFTKWKNDSSAVPPPTAHSESSNNFIANVILSTITVVTAYQSLVVFSFNSVLIGLFIYSIIQYKFDKNNLLKGIIFFFFNIYTVCAIHRLFLYFGLKSSLDKYVAVLIGLILTLLPLFLKNKDRIISKVILIEQLFIPMLLFIYLLERYRLHLNLEYVKSDVLIQIKVLIYILVSAFIIEAIYLLKKNWNQNNSLDKIISFGSCISVMGYNLFEYIGNRVHYDMHHPFEDFIGFHQIFQMGQMPFDQYIPVSGMYSVVHGFFFHFFGNGLISQYFPSKNIYMLTIAIIILLLLKSHLNRSFIFLFSVLYFFSPYTHAFYLLPIMLLLSMPKLIENKNLWLKIYVLTSLFHGLYYPCYGAALCLGFAPFAVFQFITYIKSDNFKRDCKTIKFYVYWLLCFAPVILSVKLLIGTYIHVHAMSAQTILADGISRFGQGFGKSLFPYLSNSVFYKTIIIYILTFLIPALLVLVAWILTMKFLNLKKNQALNTENIKKACLMLSLAIFPLVAYSFTSVRLDINGLYARNGYVLSAGVVMLIIYILNYSKDEKLQAKVICFALSILMLASMWGFIYNEKKLRQAFPVPDAYIQIENEKNYKIGSGFIHKDTYDLLKNFKKPNDTENYFAYEWFAFYYIFDIKGVSVLEAYTVKGYGAVKETIQNLLRNNAKVSYYYNPITNYYLHNYLMTSGKYVWDDEKKEFYPNNGKYDFDEVNKLNKKFNARKLAQEGVYKVSNDTKLTFPSSGLSMKSLSKIFTKFEQNFTLNIDNNKLQIVFEKPVNGNDTDFIYIAFSNMDKNYKYAFVNWNGLTNVKRKLHIAKYFMKKNYNDGMQVKLEWFDENQNKYSMPVSMGQGKLLIPLGAGDKWLLHNHNYLNISVFQDGKEVPIPQVENVTFLKLRKVD